MHQLGDNHADGARRVAAAVAQLLGNDIGEIVVLAGKLLDFLSPLARYAGTVAPLLGFQSPKGLLPTM